MVQGRYHVWTYSENNEDRLTLKCPNGKHMALLRVDYVPSWFCIPLTKEKQQLDIICGYDS